MAAAAVDVHKPNRRLMVRRRSGHAIAPAVVYDARLATPGPKRPCHWLEKEMQPVIRARRVHHGGFLHGARRALVVSTSRLDAAVVAKGR